MEEQILNILKNLQSDMKTMQSDMKMMQSDIKAMQSDIKEMQSDIKTMKSDISNLKEQTKEVSTAKEFGEIRAELKIINDRLDEHELGYREHDYAITRIKRKLGA